MYRFMRFIKSGFITLIFIFLSTLWTTRSEESFVPKSNKLLVILFDGFRWNYFENFNNLPNFKRFRSRGVHAEYMTPNFPSLSYPGYYSILTGRYAESHGFVGNTMYDEHHDMYFFTDTDANGSMPMWWNYAESFWMTSAKAGRKTFVFDWPGCHVWINGIRPAFCDKYGKYDTSKLKSNFRHILHRFSNNEADVGLIYTEVIDRAGHYYGPESLELKTVVRQVDEAIGVLLDIMDQRQLSMKVNIILVSDHGMTDVSKASRIQLDEFIDLNDVIHLLGYGSVTGIKPINGKLEKVYADLKKVPGLHVWKAEEIPESLHIKNHYRIPPLLIATKPNVFIEPLLNNAKQFPPRKERTLYLGYHGYLPSECPDMRAIFLAKGPNFKANYSAPPINMVDVYNLMTYLIQIKGQPNNGTWDSVSGMLASAPKQ